MPKFQNLVSGRFFLFVHAVGGDAAVRFVCRVIWTSDPLSHDMFATVHDKSIIYFV